ncbi:MAG: hypothetical protein NWR72_03475 [Bacteroidia bacterium]|nr:hypothetical protein [Bacteroidia bacterium]
MNAMWRNYSAAGLLCFVLLLFQEGPCLAQIDQSDTISLRTAQVAWASAQGANAQSSPLFTGIKYFVPNPNIEGNPWLLSNEEAGTVTWRGHELPATELKYDLVIDQVVVRQGDPVGILISLSPSLVPAFSILGRRFALPEALPRGDVPGPLAQGYHESGFVHPSLSFIIKHRKILDSQSSSTDITWSFADRSLKYVYQNESYQRFTNKKSLLAILRTHKKDLRKYIRQNHIRVRKATVPELVPVFRLYATLEK